MSNESLHDLLVLGAGPAGAAAAAFAAKSGMRVMLLDRNDTGPCDVRSEWLTERSREQLDCLDWKPTSDTGRVQRLVFLDPRGDRSAEVKIDDRVDLVDSAKLTSDLVTAAEAHGASVAYQTEIIAIEAGEDDVQLSTSDGRAFRAKLLLAADGCDAWSAHHLGAFPQTLAGRPSVCVESHAVQLADSAAKNTIQVVLGESGFSRYGQAFFDGTRNVVGVVQDEDLPGQLERVVHCLVALGVLDGEATFDSASTTRRFVPRGRALDMETHVAKRCLIIGDAGGFVSALSQEGLFPAIWSAQIAVATCQKALASSTPQDVLAEFDTDWRCAMVEHLRLPNVDLGFLLPLVFSNERMAAKLAAAFLFGENI